MKTGPPQAVSAPSVFLSYSHNDQLVMNELTRMLAPLQDKHKLDVWSDQRIPAGSDWRAEIDHALNSAHIAVMLVPQCGTDIP